MAQSVIIVGAGMIGAATALQMAKAGWRVTVLAAGGADATSASFGWINASFYLSPDHHRLRAAGLAAWHRLQDVVATEVAWQGCLCWDMNAQGLAETEAQLQALDYPVSRITSAELQQLEPYLLTTPDAALHFRSEGAAQSGNAATALLRAAQRHGAQVIRNAVVSEVLLSPSPGVSTQSGKLMADQVILAAGTGTPVLARSIGVDIPLVHRPAYILRTAPVAPLLNHVLVTPVGEIRQEPDGSILMPVAPGHQADAADQLAETPDQAADAAMARLRGVLRLPDDLDWAEVTSAERPVPQDGLPVVGPVAEGVYVAVMHSGITLGPVMAELIAAELSQRRDNAAAATLAAYRPDRFA